MVNATERGPIRVLVVTNMYPSPDRPAYGNFVREQVESLRALGVVPGVLFIDGRTSRAEYARAIARVRHAARGAFDLLHAHYGLTGFFAVLQSRLPVVITFHGDDLLGTPGVDGRPTAKSRAPAAENRLSTDRPAPGASVHTSLRRPSRWRFAGWRAFHRSTAPFNN